MHRCEALCQDIIVFHRDGPGRARTYARSRGISAPAHTAWPFHIFPEILLEKRYSRRFCISRIFCRKKAFRGTLHGGKRGKHMVFQSPLTPLPASPPPFGSLVVLPRFSVNQTTNGRRPSPHRVRYRTVPYVYHAWYGTVCQPRVVRYRMSTTRGTVPTVVCVPMHMTDMSISMLRMQLYVCV